MILKVQCDTTGQRVLVYNQSRDLFTELEGEQAVEPIESYGLTALSKIYVNGSYDATTGQLHLAEMVEDQDW